MKKIRNRNQDRDAPITFCETFGENKKSPLSDLYTPEDLEQMFADNPPKINNLKKKPHNKSHQVLKCFTQIKFKKDKIKKSKKNKKNSRSGKNNLRTIKEK